MESRRLLLSGDSLRSGSGFHLEFLLLLSCHILLHQASRVRNLTLLVDVVFYNIITKHALVRLDDLAHCLDVEVITVHFSAQISWKVHGFVGGLCTAARNREGTYGRGDRFNGDHHG